MNNYLSSFITLFIGQQQQQQQLVENSFLAFFLIKLCHHIYLGSPKLLFVGLSSMIRFPFLSSRCLKRWCSNSDCCCSPVYRKEQTGRSRFDIVLTTKLVNTFAITGHKHLKCRKWKSFLKMRNKPDMSIASMESEWHGTKGKTTLMLILIFWSRLVSTNSSWVNV